MISPTLKESSLTFSIQFFVAFSILVGTLNKRTDAESFSNGKTDTKMRPARISEQIGSAISQSYQSMRREEMITATLPKVSASM